MVGAIRCKFAESGNPTNVPNLKGGTFKAKLTEGGIEVDNLGSQPFLPWAAFQAAVSILIKNGGRAKRGNAMGSRLGEPDLHINSVEGYAAQMVYGKRVGEIVFRRITPIAASLYGQVFTNTPQMSWSFRTSDSQRVSAIAEAA